jgi:hypothetical protein
MGWSVLPSASRLVSCRENEIGGKTVADRLRGQIFGKEPGRGLGEFEYVRHANDEVTLWTIPGTSDHVGFLKLQNENKTFVLQPSGAGEQLEIVVTDVKPSGDRFEVAARAARRDWRPD